MANNNITNACKINRLSEEMLNRYTNVFNITYSQGVFDQNSTSVIIEICKNGKWQSGIFKNLLKLIDHKITQTETLVYLGTLLSKIL